MKNLTKPMILTLTSVFAMATNAEVMVRPQSTPQLIESLKSQRLNQNDVNTALAPVTEGVPANNGYIPVSDIVLYTEREGIPNGAGAGLPDFAAQPYSAVELLEQALVDRMTMGEGQRISFLQEQAEMIVTISGRRADEALMRYTLNRSLDVMDHVLPIAGRNTAEIQRWVANFYRRNFELAASYANNRMGLKAMMALPGEISEDATKPILRNLDSAEYGVNYANLLWQFSTGLSSNSSKSVMLMRLVGYLGWDINSDLRRRERPLAQTIFDIYKLQHSSTYNSVLRAFESGNEPSSADVASLRSQVNTLLTKMPARLEALKAAESSIR